jgi:hypothetical protein
VDLIEEIDDENHSEKTCTEADYHEFMRAWKAEERVGRGARGEFQLEFRDTILPIWELMGWAKDTLAALSFRSDDARRIYTTVQDLTFVKHFEHYIWWSPFGTLRGLDALIVLLQAAQSGCFPEPGAMTAEAPVERPSTEATEISIAPPEDRLAQFMKRHPGTTYADIKHSAKVYTADFQKWRKGKLKPDSVMSQRIENVIRGDTQLMKKPHKPRRD